VVDLGFVFCGWEVVQGAGEDGVKVVSEGCGFEAVPV